MKDDPPAGRPDHDIPTKRFCHLQIDLAVDFLGIAKGNSFGPPGVDPQDRLAWHFLKIRKKLEIIRHIIGPGHFWSRDQSPFTHMIIIP